VVVEPFFVQQFLVAALLDDLAIVDYQHVVGIPPPCASIDSGNQETVSSSAKAQASSKDIVCPASQAALKVVSCI